MNADALRNAGVAVDDAAHARLERFLELLLEENQRVNLTGIRDLESAWVLHVCDSLAVLPLLRGEAPGRLLDLGSGGGLPGVPIACACPEIEVTLLDSTGKKLKAVERIVTAMRLPNVRMITQRAELAAHEDAHRERYDVLVARAVGPLNRLLEYAAGLIRPAGSGLFYKSVTAAQDEVSDARTVAKACLMTVADRFGYELPEPHGKRTIVVYRKNGRLREDLPRPPWQAKNKPLE